MRIIYLIILTATLLTWGCRSGKPVVPRYYIIEYPEKEFALPDTLFPVHGSIEILPVDVYPAFSSHRIAVRENTHELRYFANNEWAVRPQESLTRYILDFIRRNKVFSQAESRFWNQIPDYKLETTVINLEVVHDHNTYYARMNLEFKLYDSATGSYRVSHTADKLQRLPRRNLNQFADALSLMFWEETEVFFIKVLSELTTN